MGLAARRIAQGSAGTGGQPLGNGGVDIGLGCLWSDPTEPGTLHPLAELIHIEGKPQTSGSQTVAHDQESYCCAPPD